MGLITATFFECGVRYERTTEEGTTKKVNELYIVDALTFTEAESRITEEMKPYVSGDFEVDATDKSNPYVSAKENVTDEISFKFELTSDTKEIHFYMPVPVGVYNG